MKFRVSLNWFQTFKNQIIATFQFSICFISFEINIVFCVRAEAILESLEDEAQGADILMVKPALAYLDIIRDIRERTLLPLAAYNVSGEYAMLKFAQKANLIDYERVLLETMLGFKRAGADIIITYHAKEIAKLI